MTRKIIIASTKITRQFQITLPKPVRETFGFKQGDQLFFIIEEDEKGKKLILMKGPIELKD